ncbi:MAG TPA: hypothetical protein VIM51_11425 [Desulfosporosinus sp.]
MNRFHKDFKISILRVCEKVETLAKMGIRNNLAKPSDFFPYIQNFRDEIMGITTDEGFKSYYGNWGVKELDSLIKQVCGKICVCGCKFGTSTVMEHECDMCPISCYRETYGSNEDIDCL